MNGGWVYPEALSAALGTHFVMARQSDKKNVILGGTTKKNYIMLIYSNKRSWSMTILKELLRNYSIIKKIIEKIL